MASRVGWTDKNDYTICQSFLYDAPLDHCSRRVCVTVQPCPKSIPRSELAATLERGWEVRLDDGIERVVTDVRDSVIFTGVRDSVIFTGGYWTEPRIITHIRGPGCRDEHGKPVWTEVVDD